MSLNRSGRILVLTLSFGSGHVRAARAVAEEIKREAPQADVKVCDALEDCRLFFRAIYVWPYWAMVRYAPLLWSKFFSSRVARRDERTAPARLFRKGCPRVFELIEEFQPETIVAVEVAACEMAVIARQARLTDARIINVITDYEAEPVWVKPEVEAYAVADECVSEQLCSWGAPPASISVCGIPTDRAFGVAHDAHLTRARLGIDDEMPLVLLMGGGMGPTRMDKLAARLCESRIPLRVIAIAGLDGRMHERLGRISARHTARLRVLGWTDDVAALMQAATVLVTKPGGLTMSEAALCGLPVVLFGGIPGPEMLNAARFIEAGAAVSARSDLEASEAVEMLLRDERLRSLMSLHARSLARPDAAHAIARLALDRRETVVSESPQRMTA